MKTKLNYYYDEGGIFCTHTKLKCHIKSPVPGACCFDCIRNPEVPNVIFHYYESSPKYEVQIKNVVLDIIDLECLFKVNQLGVNGWMLVNVTREITSVSKKAIHVLTYNKIIK
jgi:hypothetical protein